MQGNVTAHRAHLRQIAPMYLAQYRFDGQESTGLSTRTTPNLHGDPCGKMAYRFRPPLPSRNLFPNKGNHLIRRHGLAFNPQSRCCTFRLKSGNIGLPGLKFGLVDDR